jgi:hypothetical protein
MERRLLIAAGHTSGGGAKARGHVEGAEAIDIVNRVVAKCQHDGRIEVRGFKTPFRLRLGTRG